MVRVNCFKRAIGGYLYLVDMSVASSVYIHSTGIFFMALFKRIKIIG